MKRSGILAAAAALVAALALPATAANVTMRASHQFPGGKGDVRDDMVQMIAKDVQAAMQSLAPAPARNESRPAVAAD